MRVAPVMQTSETKMRIMILEDDTALTDQMMSLIKSAGHVCHWFPTGQKMIAN
jgi:DNA-binding response OmpR family regulator